MSKQKWNWPPKNPSRALLFVIVSIIGIYCVGMGLNAESPPENITTHGLLLLIWAEIMGSGEK